MDYPIQPEHIRADILFRVAEQIVLLCQKKGGWYPFAVSELMGITSYQLKEIRGLVLINNQFHLSHEFVSTVLSFAPAVSAKRQQQLILQAHQKAMSTVFYQTWHKLPEIIAIVSFLLAGFSINLWHSGSISEAMAQMILWPIGPHNVSTLITWLGMICFGVYWVRRQRKDVCLAPMLNWYTEQSADADGSWLVDVWRKGVGLIKR